MNNYYPKISIVIPAYNASNYLAEAIDCALAQTYKNVEIIVVNDGSCDNNATADVAARYGDKIRYYEKENGGSSSALNYGIGKMTGEWFSWLSHDDLYYPEKIEAQVEYMNSICTDEAELENHVFFTAAEYIDKNGKVLRSLSEDENKAISDFVEALSDNRYLIVQPITYSFHGCGCLINRNVFEKIGYFDENLRLLNDIDFWFRIYSAQYKIHFIPRVLVKGRVHDKQISKSIGFSYNNSENDMFWNRTLEWIIENCADDYKAFYAFGKEAFLKTRFKEGKTAFEYAGSINKKAKALLFIKSLELKAFAFGKGLAKKVYLKIKF